MLGTTRLGYMVDIVDSLFRNIQNKQYDKIKMADLRYLNKYIRKDLYNSKLMHSFMNGDVALIPISPNLEKMVISAERYNCGRVSSTVDTFLNYLTELLPYLSDRTLAKIVNDIAEVETLNSKDVALNTELMGLIPRHNKFGDKEKEKRWKQLSSDIKNILKERESYK